MLNEKQKKTLLKNGVKLTGEVVLSPGASLFLDGRIKPALLHAGAGILAKLALGAPGLLLVAANSYSVSRTGKNLVSSLFGPRDPKDESLKKKVTEGVDAGMTLEEINAGIEEDVEDIHEEIRTSENGLG